MQLQIRRIDGYVSRAESEWPLARTQWTKFYLDPAASALGRTPAKAVRKIDYDAMGNGLLFLTAPLEAETEFTGPVAAKLFVSSSTNDADLFLGLHLFAPDGNEVTFLGRQRSARAGGAGLAARLAPQARSRCARLPYRPYHAHDEIQPLAPGEPVELDVEIWPTCIVVPQGYRLGLTVRGKDISPDDPPQSVGGATYKRHANIGPFKHIHPEDRPPSVFGGKNALHFDAQRQPFLLLPVIPPKS